MSKTLSDNFLEHYGVKGMKWGIRRKRKKTTHKSEKQARKAAKKMSDQELREKLNRLNMEQQYVRLTTGKSSPGVVSKGKGFVVSVVSSAARKSAKNYVSREITAQLTNIREPGTTHQIGTAIRNRRSS